MDIAKVKDSMWYDVEFVPDKYILAEKDRPENVNGPVCDSIPVIDLAKHKEAFEAMLMASQEVGFFKVINHGVPTKILDDTINVHKEFHEMPSKEAKGDKEGWVHENNTSVNGVYLWRETMKHSCHPLPQCMDIWPQKPTKYREVMKAYILEIQKLSERILEMICEGLGLEAGYLKDKTEIQLMVSSFYPACPDPSLTIGLLGHKDPSYITILYQTDAAGLQILKDGQWVNVGSNQDSFVVNIGNQLEIVSNGKLKSCDHRVVNSTEDRISIATHMVPTPNCVIEPAKVLVNESEPARYEPILYKEYAHSKKVFGKFTAAIYNT